MHRTKKQDGFSHHFLLPIIAVLLIAGIGAFMTFRSNAAVPTLPFKQGVVDDGALVDKYDTAFSQVRDYTTGGSKNPYAFAILKGGMRHTVLNVGLRELVSVDPTTGATTYIPGSLEARIKNAVTWNKSHPYKKLTVHLRFQVGQTAPDAWKTLCGTVVMSDPNFGTTAIAPRWWVKSDDGTRYIYRELYANAMNALAPAVAAINANPATPRLIGSVNVPAAAPNYAEPMIIYANSPTVRAALIEGGFTAEEHNSFMLWAPTVASVFTDVGVELALNPYDNIDAAGNQSTTDKLMYQQVADVLINTVGSRAVLANYSARYAFTKATFSGDYATLYRWMIEKSRATPRVWTGVQMARPSKIAIGAPIKDPEQWDNVALWAAAKGFNYVETSGVLPKTAAAIKPATYNIWPTSYHDDKNDVADFVKITNNLLLNPHP